MPNRLNLLIYRCRPASGNPQTTKFQLTYIQSITDLPHNKAATDRVEFSDITALYVLSSGMLTRTSFRIQGRTGPSLPRPRTSSSWSRPRPRTLHPQGLFKDFDRFNVSSFITLFYVNYVISSLPYSVIRKLINQVFATVYI